MDKLDPHRADYRRSNFEFESNILLFFRQVFFDTILVRGFCLASLGEANGKHAEHVVVSCLHIHMSLNEGLLSLRVRTRSELLLRRLWVAAKSLSVTFSAHSELVF